MALAGSATALQSTLLELRSRLARSPSSEGTRLPKDGVRDHRSLPGPSERRFRPYPAVRLTFHCPVFERAQPRIYIEARQLSSSFPAWTRRTGIQSFRSRAARQRAPFDRKLRRTDIFEHRRSAGRLLPRSFFWLCLRALRNFGPYFLRFLGQPQFPQARHVLTDCCSFFRSLNHNRFTLGFGEPLSVSSGALR